MRFSRTNYERQFTFGALFLYVQSVCKTSSGLSLAIFRRQWHTLDLTCSSLSFILSTSARRTPEISIEILGAKSVTCFVENIKSVHVVRTSYTYQIVASPCSAFLIFTSLQSFKSHFVPNCWFLLVFCYLFNLFNKK